LEGPSAIEAETRFVLDPLPRLVEGSERLHIDLRNVGHRLESRLSFRYERLSCAHQPDLVRLGRSRIAALREGEGTTLDVVEPLVAGSDPAEVRQRTQEQLLALDQLLATGGKRSLGVHHAMRRIIQLVTGSAVATEEVMRRLRESSCGDALASILTTCLGAAGTRKAQEGLCEILTQGRWSDQRRHMALLALPQVNAPVRELDFALTRLREERGALSRVSFLVLAAVGDKVRESDPVRFERIREYVEADLRATPDSPRLAHALNALANLGPSDVPAPVKQALSHESEAVRAAATRALARIRAPEAGRLLTEMLRDDPSPRVRTIALRMLARRQKIGLVEEEEARILFRAAAASDPTDKVRDLAARLARST
ncbi:MAG: HEAT repeat domain-containing protein, partial [Planctomycetota bacterium]